jgi:biotin carboxyl carrier protein
VTAQYEVEVNGRLRQVALRRADDRFVITVDGRSWTVDATRVDAHKMSLLVTEGRIFSYEVSLARDPATGRTDVRIGPVTVPVSLTGRWRSRRKDVDGHAAEGPQRLLAPMPGKVVRVLVNAGDAVRARQPIVVVEAMKMENELRAGRDGRVSELFAAGGQSVEAGALLAVIS